MCRFVLIIILFPLLFFISCQRDLPVYPIDTDFELTDHYNRAFQMKNLKGQVVLIFFAFTRCPSTCPRNLRRLEKVYNILGFRGHDLKTLMITVDPDYDVPRVLKAYLNSYKIDILGLWGKPEQIGKVMRAFGASVYPAKEANAHHQIDHSDHIFLLDKQAKVRYFFKYTDPPQKMVKIIRTL